MNGITNKKVIVKDCEFIEPLIKKIDSIFVDGIKDCHNK